MSKDEAGLLVPVYVSEDINVTNIYLFIYYLFSLALQPSAGYGLLVKEVS
jgi:hypothetical protein